MKRRRMHPIPLLLVLILMISVLPATAAGQAGPPDPDSLQKGQGESYDARLYRIDNVLTKEDRTAIAQTGAAIEEVGPDYVIVRATSLEIRKFAGQAYAMQEQIQPLDFPAADSAYHNYAEMSDEILQVASAHPDIVSRFSIGQSYEGREM